MINIRKKTICKYFLHFGNYQNKFLMHTMFFCFPYRSEEVEEKLESECGQIYSPVKHYPFFQQKEKIQPKQSAQQPLVSPGQRCS